MPLPATAQALYDLLTADPVISAGLGTYTFADGSEIPAAAVLHANEKLPPGTTATGIELTITGMPGYGNQPLLSGGTLLNPTWRIYLVGWQSPAGLQEMAERALVLLPGATATSIPGDAPGEGIGVFDQVVIAWTNPTAFVEA